LPLKSAATVSLTEEIETCRVNRRGAVAQLGECLTGSQEVTSSILVSSTIFNNLQTRHTIKGNKKVTANLTCAASRPGAVQRCAAFASCSRHSAQVRSRWPGRLRKTRSEAVAAGSDAGRSLRYRRNYADHAGTHHPIMDVMRCASVAVSLSLQQRANAYVPTTPDRTCEDEPSHVPDHDLLPRPTAGRCLASGTVRRIGTTALSPAESW
jgi:hypothetical protein